MLAAMEQSRATRGGPQTEPDVKIDAKWGYETLTWEVPHFYMDKKGTITYHWVALLRVTLVDGIVNDVSYDYWRVVDYKHSEKYRPNK